MSFKRDCDDNSLLRNLKFRRVSEILAQQIPEDEARLLSNGRLTCIVCLHRPVFDNINMLSIHRKGRRHIAELSKYLLRKRELQLKMQKSSQLQELRANTKNPGVKINEEGAVGLKDDLESSFGSAKQKSHPLLAASPYSSCCSKKRSQKIPLAMQRRMVLETPKLMPPSSALVIENSETSQCPSAHSEVRRYLKALQRKKPLSRLVEKLKEGYSLPKSQPEFSQSVTSMNVSVHKEDVTPKKIADLPKNGSQPDERKALEAEKIKRTLDLTMSGWIWQKDIDGGKWVKDPNAEFDSDEEEPPAML